jgi:hypothetical protein
VKIAIWEILTSMRMVTPLFSSIIYYFLTRLWSIKATWSNRCFLVVSVRMLYHANTSFQLPSFALFVFGVEKWTKQFSEKVTTQLKSWQVFKLQIFHLFSNSSFLFPSNLHLNLKTHFVCGFLFSSLDNI